MKSLGSVSQTSNNLVTMGAILVTALVVGGGVYVWQQSQLKDAETRLQTQIDSLQSQLAAADSKTSDQDGDAASSAGQDDNSGTEEQGTQTGFAKLKEDGNYIYYGGTATLSGTYQELLGNTSPLSNILCFYPDQSSVGLLPDRKSSASAGYLCFDNQDQAKAALGINDDQLSSLACIEGKATIKISDYKTSKIEGESSDGAMLDQAVSKEAYHTSCSR